jgi:hypothetical protein
VPRSGTFEGFTSPKMATPFLGFTAITEQTQTKKDFEGVAKQRLQNLSWFRFERKALL